MTTQEFIQRIIGAPWVRWRSGFDGTDCFGVLILYHREVLGVDLGDVPQTDIAAGFSRASGWGELPGPEAGATCWMAWRDGAPTHCGLVLPGGRVLHAEGSEERPGNVRISRLAIVRRIYGEIRFYRHEAAAC